MAFLYFCHQFGFIMGSAAVASAKPLDTGSVALCFFAILPRDFIALFPDVPLSVAVRAASYAG